jgi:hypothetical protein
MKAIAALASFLLIGLVACTDREGTAENIGERIDNAAGEAGERIENAADEVQEAAGEVGDALRDR